MCSHVNMAVFSNNISVIDQSYVQYISKYYQYAIFMVSDRTANSLQLRLMQRVLSNANNIIHVNLFLLIFSAWASGIAS